MPVITDPNQPYFKNGIWGWDSLVWRKLPLVFGYSDTWAEIATDAAIGAGSAVASTVAVPPGYIYVLRSLAITHNAAANNQVYVYLMTTGDDPIIYHALAQPQIEYVIFRCDLVLKHLDYIQATAVTPGAGKSVTIDVSGYKMLIAE